LGERWQPSQSCDARQHHHDRAVECDHQHGHRRLQQHRRPIVLDLGQNGITFSSVENGVQFDMDADGEKEQLAWTNGEDGLLVMDLDGSGAIENGTEVLSPYFKDGGFGNSLDALASLDGNGDGILDLSDAAFGDLRVWSDANRDGESQASELLGLSDIGIESIDLGAIVGDSQIDGQHVFAQGHFTMT
jgi:hypothetical protein